LAVFSPDGTGAQFRYLDESKYDITDMHANAKLHWLGELLLNVLRRHCRLRKVLTLACIPHRRPIPTGLYHRSGWRPRYS